MFEFLHIEGFVENDATTWYVAGEEAPEETLEDLLNVYGKEGWEIVAVVGIETITEVLMQREIVPEGG